MRTALSLLLLAAVLVLPGCRALYGDAAQIDKIIEGDQKKTKIYVGVAGSFDSFLTAAIQATDVSTDEGKARAARFQKARDILRGENSKYERLTWAQVQALLSMKGMTPAEREALASDLVAIVGGLSK